MNLTNQSRHTTLSFLISILLGIIVLGFFFAIFSGDSLPAAMKLSRTNLIVVQIGTMVSLFLLPPIFFALLTKNNMASVFNLDISVNIKKYGIATLLAIVLFPALVNIQYIITQIPLPSEIRNFAEVQKAANEQMIELFLNYPGLPNLFLMLFMIGFGAGLTEELFFRGFLMKMIERWTESTWTAIILTGIIFGLVHFNFYDFLPITLVGILFGYIYTQTQDLKLNIYIHSLYNSIQVILHYCYLNGYISKDIDKVEYVPVYLWVASTALSIFFVYQIVKKYAYVSR